MILLLVIQIFNNEREDDDMNMNIINVTNTGSASEIRPGFRFNGQWLPKMGFVPDALVKAIPEAGGMDFILHDEYICSFRELDASVRKRGGKLINVPYANESSSPCLMASGRFINNAGLNIGDAFLARYGYGIIQARRLPSNIKDVIRIRVWHQLDKLRLKAQLAGDWLLGLGFTPKTSVAAISMPGQITFEIIDRLSDLYFSHQTKIELLQVRETYNYEKLYPYITIPIPCLHKALFPPGDTLLASCEPGIITLQRPDFEALGF